MLRAVDGRGVSTVPHPSVADVARAPDGTVHVTHVVQQIAPDRLISISNFAATCELEVKGVKKAAQRAGVPMAMVGRELVARYSDLVAMIDQLSAAPAKPSTAPTSYQALVQSAKGGRR